MDTEERCIKCVIPRSSRGIKFDDHGCCELCLNYQPEKESAEKRIKTLNKRIKNIKKTGQNRDFDCLVGLSGGRDSSYLLYLLVKKHKLRCMAAYHRTPFTPDIIDTNVKRLTQELNVPLIQMQISIKKHLDFARKMMKLWIKNPDRFIINLACAPCKQHNYEVYRIAKHYKIRYIVFGSNKYETFQLSAAQDKNINNLKTKEIGYFQKIKQLILVSTRGIKILLNNPLLLLSFPMLFKTCILYLNNRSPYLRARFNHIKMLDYYFLAGYNEDDANKFLADFKLEIPDDCTSIWRADCAFNDLKNYLFKKVTGMSYMDAYLSNMIRDRFISRDEALKRLKTEGKISWKRLNRVSEILNIPISKFDV